MQCYFIAILSTVLVNVLLINSMQLEPRVQNIFLNNENSDEKLAEDGTFYNPNPGKCISYKKLVEMQVGFKTVAFHIFTINYFIDEYVVDID